MNSKKKYYLISISIGIILLTFFFYYQRETSQKKSNNVLIISFCSISSDILPVYNLEIDGSSLPNFFNLFSKSTNFLNTYGSTSWVNTGYYLFQKDYRKTYGNSYTQYHPIMRWDANGVSNLIMRIPPDKNIMEGYEDYYNESRIQLPFNQINQNIEAIKSHFKKDGNNLFMLHFKIAHYPLLNETILNNQNLLNQIFNQEEIKYITQYLNAPEKNISKYPFFQYLFGSKKFENKFKLQQAQKSYLTNFKSVEGWKKSQNYQVDLSIIRKAYLYRIKTADQLLGKYLNFYKTIEDNTTLIITGDHGETLGKRDYISHGETPYDEVIKIFTSIHFPHQNSFFNINEQISQRTIGRLIEGIALGNYNQKNINDLEYRPKNDDVISSYNCSGDIASLRINNKWKLIYHFQSDKSEFYDLTIDPKELNDISKLYPDLVIQYQYEIKDRIKDRILSKDKCIK